MKKIGDLGATELELSPSQRETLLRKAWYSHDARWFSAVAGEFGMEVANRLNRRVVRSIGQVEVRRLARVMGVASAQSLDEFLAFLELGRELYVTDEALGMSIQAIDESTYTITVGDCFVAENTRLAGVSDTYECAVFDRVQGWHDALGLPLTEDELPAVKCPRAAGGECVRTFTLQVLPASGGDDG